MERNGRSGQESLQGRNRRTTQIAPRSSGAWIVGLMLLTALVVGPSAVLADGNTDWWEVPIGVADTPYETMKLGTQGGTLRLASLEEPLTWNDAVALDPFTSRFTNLVFRSMIAFDPVRGDLNCGLAKSWEVSDGGLTVFLYLREGVRWSDGEPFTADDVLFTYKNVICNPEVTAAYRDRLRLPDGRFPECEKLDNHTVRFSVKTYFRPLLRCLTFNILPEHKLAEYVAAGTFNDAWSVATQPEEIVGLGPYLLEEHHAQQFVGFTRNPNYYARDPQGTQLPYYDRVIYRFVGGSEIALALFLNGEIDSLDPLPQDYAQLLSEAMAREQAGQPGWTVVVTGEPTYEVVFAYLNQDLGMSHGDDADEQKEKRDLYRNSKFREALAHCIDQDAMVNNVFSGLALEAWSPVAAASPYYGGREDVGTRITEEEAYRYAYDPARSEELLDTLGVVDRDGDGWRDLSSGADLVIRLESRKANPWVQCALILADDLGSIGIRCELETYDYSTLWRRMVAGEVDAALFTLLSSDEPHDLAGFYRVSGLLCFAEVMTDAPRMVLDEHIEWELGRGLEEASPHSTFYQYVLLQGTVATENDYFFLVNETFTYAYYSHVGNAQVSNPRSTPDGADGRLVEFLFDNRL